MSRRPAPVIPIGEWSNKAACKGKSDLFFVVIHSKAPKEKQRVQDEQLAAERICWNECPVQKECLTHAVNTRQDDGTWGGFTGRKILREGARWLKNLK